MKSENSKAGCGDRFQGDKPLMLAIDTSTDIGTVGLGFSCYQCYESYFKIEKGHSGRLMPMIDSLFKKLFIAPEDIDLVVAGTGPGTFSGVKIGVTTAKSLAFGLSKGLVGICSLDIMAASVTRSCDLVISVMDARRDMLYAASYKPVAGMPEKVLGPVCLQVEEAAKAVLEPGCSEVFVVGSIQREFLDTLHGAGVSTINSREAAPGARDMFWAGRHAALSGLTDPCEVEPIYLKNPT
ncbi:MAG: tRNA (adenosine(37)-N6)-threonylcarbamoyltransferase complex dimerization subunit type 1 TsaB [Actinobacteria bacterium]|nr:tRNA (adenosine(37)-N6)-threonylcarbamoyltransferase complex dimerization subunit type 1 TsaB [Actinomycetota bacterium]